MSFWLELQARPQVSTGFQHQFTQLFKGSSRLKLVQPDTRLHIDIALGKLQYHPPRMDVWNGGAHCTVHRASRSCFVPPESERRHGSRERAPTGGFRTHQGYNATFGRC